jgi:hypothetical protein
MRPSSQTRNGPQPLIGAGNDQLREAGPRTSIGAVFAAIGFHSGVLQTDLNPNAFVESSGIGALFPYLVGALSTTTTLANAIAIFAAAAYATFFLAAFALPETRGRVLHSEA